MDTHSEWFLAGSADECFSKFENTSIKGNFCSVAWDSLSCWPPTSAGQTVSFPCYFLFSTINLPNVTPNDARAYRMCSEEGEWLWGNWTNYTQCMEEFNVEVPSSLPLIVAHILFVGSALSLVTLTVTFFIFWHFKSLQCSRLQVHRNLVVALVIHSALLMIMASSVVIGGPLEDYKEDWLCKALVASKMYASMATVNWMFIEGLLLHSRITVSIFRQDAPFKLYYVIGWGVPILFLGTWVVVSSTMSDEYCWKGYGKSPFVWIVTGPMIAALTINTIFLVNIIRILVTKLRSHSSVEVTQIRKAMKATALLFPLLGIPHLLFCINPREVSGLESVYMVFNGVLQSFQGLFVAVLYCFMNSEVQTVLRNAYLRAVLRRNPNHKYARGRALSRTSTTYLSTYERSHVDSAFKGNQKNKSPSSTPVRQLVATNKC